MVEGNRRGLPISYSPVNCNSYDVHNSLKGASRQSGKIRAFLLLFPQPWPANVPGRYMYDRKCAITQAGMVAKVRGPRD